jgi:hypothetical protein
LAKSVALFFDVVVVAAPPAGSVAMGVSSAMAHSQRRSLFD